MCSLFFSDRVLFVLVWFRWCFKCDAFRVFMPNLFSKAHKIQIWVIDISQSSSQCHGYNVLNLKKKFHHLLGNSVPKKKNVIKADRQKMNILSLCLLKIILLHSETVLFYVL